MLTFSLKKVDLPRQHQASLTFILLLVIFGCFALTSAVVLDCSFNGVIQAPEIEGQLDTNFSVKGKTQGNRLEIRCDSLHNTSKEILAPEPIPQVISRPPPPPGEPTQNPILWPTRRSGERASCSTIHANFQRRIMGM